MFNVYVQLEQDFDCNFTSTQNTLCFRAFQPIISRYYYKVRELTRDRVGHSQIQVLSVWIFLIAARVTSSYRILVEQRVEHCSQSLEQRVSK